VASYPRTGTRRLAEYQPDAQSVRCELNASDSLSRRRLALPCVNTMVRKRGIKSSTPRKTKRSTRNSEAADLCDHSTNQFKAELSLMRASLSTLRQNTMWTAFGAVAGWIALVLVVVAII